MEDINAQVLSGFNINPKSITKSKLLYILKTSTGTKQLRLNPSPAKRICFAHNVKENLLTNGFGFTDRFIPSVQNRPYYQLGNNTYTMTPFIEGHESDFSDAECIKKSICRIAQMHKDSAIIKNFNETPPISENLINYCEKKIKRFKALKKQTQNKSSYTDFDIIFIKNFDFFLNEAEKSVNLLKESSYDKLYKKAIENNSIAHHGLMEETILHSKTGVYIMGFEGCTVDIPLMDLADIIKRYIRKHNENYAGANELISEYCKINPLSKEEIDVLYAYLVFPDKFINTIIEFYSKKRSFTPNSTVNRLTKTIGQKIHYKNYIEDIKKL